MDEQWGTRWLDERFFVSFTGGGWKGKIEKQNVLMEKDPVRRRNGTIRWNRFHFELLKINGSSKSGAVGPYCCRILFFPNSNWINYLLFYQNKWKVMLLAGNRTVCKMSKYRSEHFFPVTWRRTPLLWYEADCVVLAHEWIKWCNGLDKDRNEEI